VTAGKENGKRERDLLWERKAIFALL